MRTSFIERAAIMPQPAVTTRTSKHRLSIWPPTTIATTRHGGNRGFPGIRLSGGFNRDDDDDDPMVVILGATGTGKSKLSIDVGTAFPSEIVNSDKIQVYKGLDITTNKLPLNQRGGIPHHLLGDLESSSSSAAEEMTPAGFRSVGSRAIAAIKSRRKLPIVAGGSNSYVHALLARQHARGRDPFKGNVMEGDMHLNYNSCCLLWVDVEWEVLQEYLDVRVEEMMDAGMVEELARNYKVGRAERGVYVGLDRSIGVPEFDKFFARFPPTEGRRGRKGEKLAMEEAVEEIKANTRRLARKQVGKIVRLKEEMGWRIMKLDATEAVRRKLEEKKKGVAAAAAAAATEEVWEKDVRRLALEEVRRFVVGEEDGSRWRRKSQPHRWSLPQVAGSV